MMKTTMSIPINLWFFLTISFCLGSNSAISQTVRNNNTIVNEYQILTPEPGPQPRINGPLVYGCRPDHPFLYRIPCQGNRPLTFSAKGLPHGLNLDPSTGIITGTAPAKGEYEVKLKAKNKFGTDKRNFKIVAGETLALTPPMGWNDWYAHYDRITDKMVRRAADEMISSGMADVGYQYVNIDDCWMNAPHNKDSLRVGSLRDMNGNILPNKYFPDMKSMTDYIHEKGLKAGLYATPGPWTCAGFEGSYQHEKQDALQFAKWGFDFLKYDWCFYGMVPGSNKSMEALQQEKTNLFELAKHKFSLEDYKKPYQLMGSILDSLDRDIVFNLCQYGMGDVWKWGAEVGGNCWRTAGDLGVSLDHIFDVALRNATYRQYSKPGAWNDPDYIQIGWIGSAFKMGKPELTQMPPAMQYAYMSLWCLMAAPLVYSGDMSKLDKFTLNVLCNPEVIDVDQDPLGQSARVIKHSDSCFFMVKNLVDGSKAVGLFNRGKSPVKVTVNWKELQIKGKQYVRDLWRQKNMGKYRQKFSAIVPAEGVVMVQMSSKKINTR